MPALVHTTALAVANLTLFVFAAGLVISLAWLTVATIWRRIDRRRDRQEFHATAHEAAAADDGNELRHIDLSRVDLDAELLQLIEGGESK